jgi:hypothetical protein
MCRWDAIRVLIDDQLVVGAIDRVVQHGLVQADLHVLYLGHRPVQRDRLSNFGRHGIPEQARPSWMICALPLGRLTSCACVDAARAIEGYK